MHNRPTIDLVGLCVGCFPLSLTHSSVPSTAGSFETLRRTYDLPTIGPQRPREAKIGLQTVISLSNAIDVGVDGP